MKCVLSSLFFKLIFPLLWIEIRHRRRHCQWENSFTHIHYIYKEKLKKKKWNCRLEKSSKATKEKSRKPQ